MSYWGYRIDNSNRDFFYDEIKQGRLRQGWGYMESQDLRRGVDTDYSAKRNFPIFNKVKKGDYLLVPRIEAWDEIVIVRATEDFCKGYYFSIAENYDDYGHVFPVEYVKRFSRQNKNVGGSIRETFKCRSRFWNIDRCEDEIKEILKRDEADLASKSSFEDRFRNKVEKVFDEKTFADEIYDELNKSSQAYEWEYILCEGFKKIFPESYSIMATSNKEEEKHGADIIIRIPGLDISYVIAIQVKDYEDVVAKDVINQISKSDEYFKVENGDVLIDKYLIVTKADKEENKELKEEADKAGVKIIFDKELKQLLVKMSKAFLGDTIFG